MFVKPENNLYKTLYLQDKKFKEGDSLDEIKFNHLYKHGNVTLKQFSDEYNSKNMSQGYLKRKAEALPLAVVAVIKTVCHLARAVFISFASLFFKSDRPLNVQFFYVRRDLEELSGRFISLFNDRCGLFLIQESQFQKECYALCIHKNPSDLSLFEFKNMSPAERTKQLTAFRATLTPSELINVPAKADEVSLDFSDEFLKDLQLKDLKDKFTESKLFYASHNDSAFEKIVLENLSKINEKQLLFIKNRFAKLAAKAQPTQPKETESASISRKPTLKDVYSLNAKEIEQYITTIPLVIFALISNNQIKGLDISKINPEQCQKLFQSLTPQQIKERLALFKDTEIQQAVQMKILCGKELQYLKDKLLEGLLLEECTEKMIENLIPPNGDIKENKRRFALLGINEVLKKDILSLYHLSLITDDQLKNIEPSRIPLTVLEKLFPKNGNLKENQRRFSLLSNETILEWNKVFSGEPWFKQLLSTKHLELIKSNLSVPQDQYIVEKEEDLSKIPAANLEYLDDQKLIELRPKFHQFIKTKARNIALLQKEASLLDWLLLDAKGIELNINILPLIAFKLFSDKQIKGLPLAKLSTEQVQALFIGRDQTETESRLNLFEINDVTQAINEGKLCGPEITYFARPKDSSVISVP